MNQLHFVPQRFGGSFLVSPTLGTLRSTVPSVCFSPWLPISCALLSPPFSFPLCSGPPK